MNTPRFALLVLLLLGALMALGRLGLEAGTWLIDNGNTHALQWAGLALALVGAFAIFSVVADAIAFGPRRRRPVVVSMDSFADGAPRRRAAAAALRVTTLSLAAIAGTTLLACSSCATMKEQGRAVAGDVVDCTTAAAAELDEQFGPVVDKVIELNIAGDGGIDWTPVRESTKHMVTDAARCVLARAVARLMRKAAPDDDAPQSAHLEVDQERLRSAWRQLADGTTYRTPYGDL